MLDLQTQALTQAGCERIFTDFSIEPATGQPNLDEAIAYARPGDVLTVWQLDRLGKPLKQLIELVIGLYDRGIHFKSLEDHLDTRTCDRSQTLRLLNAMVRSEQRIIREKTQAGLKRAKSQGKQVGRKRSLTPKQIEIGKTLATDPTQTVEDICQALKISPATYYRYIHPAVPPSNEV